MTALLNDELYLTPEEYLELEEATPIRYEYAHGYRHSLDGQTWAHSVIAANILCGLDVQLRDTPCEVLGLSLRMRVRSGEETFYYYADVFVDCSGSEADLLEEPTVVFEVVSASTSSHDQGEKLLNYLNLPSMRVYVLVDQRRVHLTVHRRAADGTWGRQVLTDLNATLALPEIGCTLPLRTILRRLPFAADA